MNIINSDDLSRHDKEAVKKILTGAAQLAGELIELLDSDLINYSDGERHAMANANGIIHGIATGTRFYPT